MKKTAAIAFFLFASSVFLPWGTPKALAEKVELASCGDYEIVTRRRFDNGQDREVFYRINNKTGETWRLEDNDVGWELLKEQ
jgi:hypothetical protein